VWKRLAQRRAPRRPPLAKLIAWSVFVSVAVTYLVSVLVPVSFGTNGWGVAISFGNVSILQESGVGGGAVKQERNVGGFGYRRASNSELRQHRFAGANLYYVPVWFPLLIAAAPVLWLAARHRRVALASMCPSCGYDCAGVPEGAVCPECGKARTGEANDR